MKVFFLYHFQLKPRVRLMRESVSRLLALRPDFFPLGKSLFVFPGHEDTLYFIVLKEEAILSILEVYDDVLNKIPSSYELLPRVMFNDVIQGLTS